MAKLNIDFVLIDESVVMHGFRALMSGARLAAFKRNPVMLFMHNRPVGYEHMDPDSDDTILALGRWYDIRVERDQLLAKPDFDDEDGFAQKIQRKVEKGYYNAASIWIDPIAVSDEDHLALPGQPGPTLTEWGVLEASIVDIPNCKNALAIRNGAGEVLQLNGNNDANQKEVLQYLNSITTKNKNEMETKFLAVKLGLDEKADEKAILDKLSELNAENEKRKAEDGKLAALQAENDALKTAAREEKVNTLVGSALDAGKITAGEKETYVKLATADFEATKTLIDGLKAHESIESKLGKAGKSSTAESYQKKSWDEIDRENKLGVLWEEYPNLYNEKFKEKFGHEPKASD